MAITSTQARSGNGSLEFNGTSSSSKADFQLSFTPFLLSSLSSLSIDIYRDSSSTIPGHLVPPVRLLVDNAQFLNRSSYLVWEPVYNGVLTVPTDTWTTYTFAADNFWQYAFKTLSTNKTIEIYDRNLAEWMELGTVTDPSGKTSNVIGPDAMVRGVQIGYGSGWTGSGRLFADNLRIGDMTFNFELESNGELPEPGTFQLIAAGLSGFLVIRRRSRRAKG